MWRFIEKLDYSLQGVRWLPWRMRYRGGPLKTLLVCPRRRRALRDSILRTRGTQPPDITVVIGVRNRGDFRLRNALAAIRGQTYPQNLIRITVVDYGSEPAQAAATEALTRRFGGDYLPAEIDGPWNRAHCLNIGIRQAKTALVLTGDVDILFADNYVEECVDRLSKDPLIFAHCVCTDLPEECTAILASDEVPTPEVLRTLRDQGQGRPGGMGIIATYREFLEILRGYDEFFDTYGGEDLDLVQRMETLGLDRADLGDKSFYLHQWHPPFRVQDRAAFEAIAQRNRDYVQQACSMIRNTEHWGEAKLRGTQA